MTQLPKHAIMRNGASNVRCVYGFVSGTIGIGLNMAVWVAWFFDYCGTWHFVSLLALALWMGAAFREFLEERK